MRVLIQRVKKASVAIDKAPVSEIGAGLLLFVGISRDDQDKDIDYLARKIVGLRIFPDERGKMNRDVREVRGELLSVSQFTLLADVSRGNRPGFDNAAEPVRAKQAWDRFNLALRAEGVPVRTGVFGAAMEVRLVNDGPVTIWLDSRETQ